MYSSNAVDGKTIQYDHDLCTHTRKTLRAWWAVDLGDVFEIQRVVLYGRTDCCSKYDVLMYFIAYIVVLTTQCMIINDIFM